MCVCVLLHVTCNSDTILEARYRGAVVNLNNIKAEAGGSSLGVLGQATQNHPVSKMKCFANFPVLQLTPYSNSITMLYRSLYNLLCKLSVIYGWAAPHRGCALAALGELKRPAYQDFRATLLKISFWYYRPALYLSRAGMNFHISQVSAVNLTIIQVMLSVVTYKLQ